MGEQNRAQLLVIERDGCSVHAWIRGDSSDPLVILLHGAGMDNRMFDPQISPLLIAGYRVMTLDQRGHGESKPLGHVPLSIDMLASDVLAFADELDVQRFVVVGQSLGGFVAQYLSVHTPNRVASVVIIGSNCTTAPLSWLDGCLLKSSVAWFRCWPWGDLRKRSAQATAITREARDYAYKAMGRLTKEEFIAVWKAVASAIQPIPGHRAIHPLLLTHGDQDNTGTVRKSVAAWAKHEPQARYEVVPNAGHNANQDNPSHFNRVLVDFLRQNRFERGSV